MKLLFVISLATFVAGCSMLETYQIGQVINSMETLGEVSDILDKVTNP